MGHPDILDSLLDCDWGLSELRSDMGAYGGGDSVGVGIDIRQITSPDRFMLLQNYPNPFNATTNISFEIANSGNVEPVMYDLLGCKVATLLSANMPAGLHTTSWNGNDSNGNAAVSGLYYYVLKTTNETLHKRMILLK